MRIAPGPLVRALVVLGALAVFHADRGVIAAELPVGELRLNSTGGELLSGESARNYDRAIEFLDSRLTSQVGD